MQSIKTVLFDLDGTLVDTAPDMANALNVLLNEENKAELSYAHIRPVVSNGSAALVQLGFPDEGNVATIERLKKRYLKIYEEMLCIDSSLFPGMAELIEYIEQNNMHWGVVTNKPGWLTQPLMQQLNLHSRAACIISGDTTANRKPHPEPMYLACKLANTSPQHCLYVGDALRDIQAGKNAGMQTMVANYGYIDEAANTADWGANYSIETVPQILNFLQS